MFAMRIAWDRVPPRPADDLTIAPFEDDATVESALDFVPGQIQHARALGGRVFLAAHRSGGIVGGAIFDPQFPGAFPFRAADAAVVFALLDAFRPHRRAGDTAVNLAIEGHRELADAIVAAGGLLRFEVERYEGPLEPG
jgi:hypothetical protein